MPSLHQKKRLHSYVMTLSLKNPPLPKKICAMQKTEKNIHAKKRSMNRNCHTPKFLVLSCEYKTLNKINDFNVDINFPRLL
jgi:hypothetical protein